jgi:hypothetical protein
LQAGRADGIDLLPEYKRFAEDNLQRLKVETGLELPNLHFEVRNCFLPDLEVRTTHTHTRHTHKHTHNAHGDGEL